MSNEMSSEIWEVEVGGEIYPAPFDELASWIDGGSLQPEDKVRKGNLRWIEARKVPALVPFFNAKQNGLPMPVVTVTHGPPFDPAPEVLPHVEATVIEEDMPQAAAVAAPTLEPVSPFATSGVCVRHSDTPSFFLCSTCASEFCKACPKAYGGSVRVCPGCGGMCRPITEVQQTTARSARRTAAIDAGFGLSDLLAALAYPFRFKTSLIVGGVMFMLFTLGQSASAIGGIYMIVGSIFSVMFANMLTFGILSNTIENFVQGELESDFMPSFDDFSLWDNVIRPFFLSIGVYVSSFGPFIVVMLIGMYLVISSAAAQMNSIEEDLKRVPGTQYYTPDRTMEQSQKVQELIGNVKKQNEERLDEQEDVAAGNAAPMVDDETAEQERLWEEVQNSRKEQLESVVGKTAEARQQENEQMLAGFLKLAAPFVVIGFLFFLWGVFYFPAACAVAGYTHSLAATLNPLVGLDTIKRLGASYVKVLLMGVAITVLSFFIGGVLAVVFAPLDLPGMGNLAAKATGSLFTFYFWIVFSCLLGFAMFKASDRLRLAA
jgi:hypothetical protein